MIITEAWADTGTITEREPTSQEVSQMQIDKEAFEAAAQAAADQAAADKAARDAAIAHAKTLGFTDAMIAVMYPNLVTEA